jgi:hypothetical protein
MQKVISTEKVSIKMWLDKPESSAIADVIEEVRTPVKVKHRHTIELFVIYLSEIVKSKIFKHVVFRTNPSTAGRKTVITAAYFGCTRNG